MWHTKTTHRVLIRMLVVISLVLVGLAVLGSMLSDPGKNSQDQTVVIFPEDYTAKFVIINGDDPPSEKRLFEAPDPILDKSRPARGKVVIPPDRKLVLRVLSSEPRGVTFPVDLSPLDQLDATDLHALAIGMADIPATELLRLKEHEALQILFLGGLSEIRGDFLSPVSKIESLKVLRVFGDTEMQPVTDAEFVQIQKLKNLEVLLIAVEIQITDAGLRYLQNLKKLRELEIKSAHISDEGLKHLQNLTQLEKLTLESPQITEEGLQSLKEQLQIKNK